jgi:hypothetical protein
MLLPSGVTRKVGLPDAYGDLRIRAQQTCGVVEVNRVVVHVCKSIDPAFQSDRIGLDVASGERTVVTVTVVAESAFALVMLPRHAQVVDGEMLSLVVFTVVCNCGNGDLKLEQIQKQSCLLFKSVLCDKPEIKPIELFF